MTEEVETSEPRTSGGMSLLGVLKTAGMKWVADDAPMMGAALAYYALFSIAPLLLVAIAIAGAVFGADAAEGQLRHHLASYFGQGAASSIETLVNAANKSRGSSTLAVLIGVGVLLYGASSVFNQLKNSLNRIWKCEKPRYTGFKGFLINRILAVVMVIGIGILLLTSILASSIITRVTDFASEEILPIPPFTLKALDMGVMATMLWIMFAAIFRFLPDLRIGWRSVVLGAAITTLLFMLGRYVISQYISRGGMASGFGAASSVLVLLIWIYYSAQIFLFGAEFTHVYSRARHLPAEPIPEEDPENCEAKQA